MKALVIGSGAREHALCWKLAQSPLIERLWAAPGNGGTWEINAPLDPLDFEGIKDFCLREGVDLVVPGPELPLAKGLADYLAGAGIACFGPDQYCARLEASKSFAKEVMREAGVPTARHEVFSDLDKALDFIRENGGPLVIKADGLAQGKGVIVCDTLEEACAAARLMLGDKAFGESGGSILIEERLMGEEASLLCFCDGESARPLPSAQDHKRAFDGDTGPNTGGMGAASPAPPLPDGDLERMADIFIRPVLKEMARRGHPYKGVLYAGLIFTKDGPKALEYNVRFGDPECEPLMMRLESDLAKIMLSCAAGSLAGEEIRFSDKAALGVVLAAEGYPGKYAKDQPISGLDQLPRGAEAFHAGTRREDGGLVSCGGRVLCATAMGADLAEAKESAYAAMEKIKMAKSRYRKDIGDKGILASK